MTKRGDKGGPWANGSRCACASNNTDYQRNFVDCRGRACDLPVDGALESVRWLCWMQKTFDFNEAARKMLSTLFFFMEELHISRNLTDIELTKNLGHGRHFENVVTWNATHNPWHQWDLLSTSSTYRRLKRKIIQIVLKILKLFSRCHADWEKLTFFPHVLVFHPRT